jgi:hypothetical protein
MNPITKYKPRLWSLKNVTIFLSRTLESFISYDVDVNKAWENIRENIEINLEEENLGYYEETPPPGHT